MGAEGTFRYDRLLTNLSIGYTNAEMVADRVFPVVPVDDRTDKYAIYGKEGLTPQDDLRAPGAEAKSSRWKISDDSYYCENHALKDGVPRENQRDAEPSFDLLQSTTLNLTEKVQLNKEVRLVSNLATAMTGASVAAQTATHWDDDANDPLGLIETQSEVIAARTGKRANVLVIAGGVWKAMKYNANVRSLITGAGNLPAAMITPAQVAAYLELDEVIVARGVKNTANEGQTPSMSYIWGETALLLVRPPNPAPRTLALGYTFAWQRALQTMAGPGAQGGNGYQMVERYWWQPTKSDIVEVHDYYDQKAVAIDAGVLFTDCLT